MLGWVLTNTLAGAPGSFAERNVRSEAWGNRLSSAWSRIGLQFLLALPK